MKQNYKKLNWIFAFLFLIVGINAIGQTTAFEQVDVTGSMCSNGKIKVTVAPQYRDGNWTAKLVPLSGVAQPLALDIVGTDGVVEFTGLNPATYKLTIWKATNSETIEYQNNPIEIEEAFQKITNFKIKVLKPHCSNDPDKLTDVKITFKGGEGPFDVWFDREKLDGTTETIPLQTIPSSTGTKETTFVAKVGIGDKIKTVKIKDHILNQGCDKTYIYHDLNPFNVVFGNNANTTLDQVSYARIFVGRSPFETDWTGDGSSVPKVPNSANDFGNDEYFNFQWNIQVNDAGGASQYYIDNPNTLQISQDGGTTWENFDDYGTEDIGASTRFYLKKRIQKNASNVYQFKLKRIDPCGQEHISNVFNFSETKGDYKFYSSRWNKKHKYKGYEYIPDADGCSATFKKPTSIFADLALNNYKEIATTWGSSVLDNFLDGTGADIDKSLNWLGGYFEDAEIKYFEDTDLDGTYETEITNSGNVSLKVQSYNIGAGVHKALRVFYNETIDPATYDYAKERKFKIEVRHPWFKNTDGTERVQEFYSTLSPFTQPNNPYDVDFVDVHDIVKVSETFLEGTVGLIINSFNKKNRAGTVTIVPADDNTDPKLIDNGDGTWSYTYTVANPVEYAGEYTASFPLTVTANTPSHINRPKWINDLPPLKYKIRVENECGDFSEDIYDLTKEEYIGDYNGSFSYYDNFKVTPRWFCNPEGDRYNLKLERDVKIDEHPNIWGRPSPSYQGGPLGVKYTYRIYKEENGVFVDKGNYYSRVLGNNAHETYKINTGNGITTNFIQDLEPGRYKIYAFRTNYVNYMGNSSISASNEKEHLWTYGGNNPTNKFYLLNKNVNDGIIELKETGIAQEPRKIFAYCSQDNEDNDQAVIFVSLDTPLEGDLDIPQDSQKLIYNLYAGANANTSTATPIATSGNLFANGTDGVVWQYYTFTNGTGYPNGFSAGTYTVEIKTACYERTANVEVNPSNVSEPSGDEVIGNCPNAQGQSFDLLLTDAYTGLYDIVWTKQVEGGAEETMTETSDLITVTPTGTTTYTATVTMKGEFCTNTSLKEFKITKKIIFEDIEAPVITLPTVASSYDTEAGDCNKTLPFTATATDNCDGTASITITYSIGGTDVTTDITGAGYSFPSGPTTVMVNATDSSGNIATETFNVIITDNVAPEITEVSTQDVEVNDACTASTTVTVTATDCGSVAT